MHYRTQGLSTADNSGNASFGNGSDVAMNGNLGATLRKALRSDLNGTLQLRGNFDQEDVVNDNSGGQVFNVSGVFTTSNTTTNKTATSDAQTIKNEGFLAGTSLDFKDRYVLDAAFRYDGSSLFGSGNRWAPFGRVSGVWRVSQEPWYNLPVLTDFRLRASHGTAGSTPRFSAQYETYNCGTAGCSLGQAGNKNLKPETTARERDRNGFHDPPIDSASSSPTLAPPPRTRFSRSTRRRRWASPPSGRMPARCRTTRTSLRSTCRSSPARI
jgi:Outer membrane cobalamin receptor protein